MRGGDGAATAMDPAIARTNAATVEPVVNFIFSKVLDIVDNCKLRERLGILERLQSNQLTLCIRSLWKSLLILELRRSISELGSYRLERRLW